MCLCSEHRVTKFGTTTQIKPSPRPETRCQTLFNVLQIVSSKKAKTEYHTKKLFYSQCQFNKTTTLVFYLLPLNPGSQPTR